LYTRRTSVIGFQGDWVWVQDKAEIRRPTAHMASISNAVVGLKTGDMEAKNSGATGIRPYLCRLVSPVLLALWVGIPFVGAQAGGDGLRAGEAGVGVTEIWFEEGEPGISTYPMRMLVSEGFLRMDDGDDRGDYILYDRGARVITSVDHAARSLIRIVHRSVEITPPLSLDTQIRVREEPGEPDVVGRRPKHVGVMANGETCYELIAVPGLLEPARRAMQELLETLAGEQAMNLGKTPVEMQTACVLTNLVFDPAKRLDYGFPIREWDDRGHVRALVRFEEGLSTDPGLFAIPAGYRIISLTPQGMGVTQPP